MSGIQSTIVNDKIIRGESLNEGKRPMSFSVYENMCKNLYECIILPSLSFNIFLHYLTTRRKKNKCYLEKTTYWGIRSALTHLFRMSGQEMENMLNVKEGRMIGQLFDALFIASSVSLQIFLIAGLVFFPSSPTSASLSLLRSHSSSKRFLTLSLPS